MAASNTGQVALATVAVRESTIGSSKSSREEGCRW